jgi:hypothetical protein
MSKKLVRALTARHGKKHEHDIELGIKACKRIWTSAREDRPAFESFCLEHYTPPGRERDQLLARLDEFHHAVSGNLEASMKVIRAGQDMADRPLTPAESVLASFSPSTHLQTDYREAHIAALIQLNFGGRAGEPRARTEWAAQRLGRVGRTAVPAKLQAALTRANAQADRFISAYNLHLDRIVFDDRSVRFPEGTRLQSHWGLRDYMMSLNGQPDALPRQRAILDLMRRVVDGEIPEAVLDNPAVTWNVPEGRIENGKKKALAVGHGPLRWEQFRKVWRAQLAIDPHRHRGNMIDEKFLEEREIPEKTVVALLTELLSSPLAERVGRFVSARLGRPLEPFDVYYRGFASGAAKAPLSYDIRERFPSAAALGQAIPRILERFGWDTARAEWIASRIRVDNARSAGHAWQPFTDHDLQLLRLRVSEDGCDELGFETFMHELGHCVEGVLTSYDMDYKILWGVPNTAFTEGFAFTFESRGDEILGRPASSDKDASTLVNFWEPFEIAGTALAEIRLYHWLYENPKASASRIQKTIRSIADEIWNAYYARIFGADGHGLLAVYSHMLWGDFYLAEYPLGYIIAYQLRRHLDGRALAPEMERICALGRIEPQVWMKEAVGSEISLEPLLEDTQAALVRLGY